MKLLFVPALALGMAVPAAAQDLLERGSDPATGLSGLHHTAADVWLTCSPHGGFVRVSVPGEVAAVTIAAGDQRFAGMERAVVAGRTAAVFDAGSGLLWVAGDQGYLLVNETELDLSGERDNRYFDLFLRICKVTE